MCDLKSTGEAAALPKKMSTKAEYDEIMKSTDAFVFDCDGVLWHGNEQIEGAVKVINQLKQLKKNVIFVTNSNMKTREEAHDKIIRMGFEDVQLKQVFSTAYTSALYLKSVISPQGKVYLVGNSAMQKELENVGVKTVGLGPDTTLTTQDIPETLKLPLDPDVEAVLVGMDGHIGLTKIIVAGSYLSDSKCKFVATNEDVRMLLADRRHVIVGAGIMVNSVALASNRRPDVVCGKPHSFMLDCVKAELELDCKRALMIGDQMKTDIAFGRRNGMKTLLVLSGIETDSSMREAYAEPNGDSPVPDFYLSSLNDWCGL